MSELSNREPTPQEAIQAERQAIEAELQQVLGETANLDKDVAPQFVEAHGVLQAWESSGVFECDPPYAVEQVLKTIQEGIDS